MSAAPEARRLFTRRDRLEREIAEIDRRLAELRSDYMREHSVYGLHPTAFRREVGSVRH